MQLLDFVFFKQAGVVIPVQLQSKLLHPPTANYISWQNVQMLAAKIIDTAK